MFFLIWGFGHQIITPYGPVAPDVCPDCFHQIFYHLTRVQTWLTLFFIPVIPYSTKYYLFCPACNLGAEVKSTDIGNVKELAGNVSG